MQNAPMVRTVFLLGFAACMATVVLLTGQHAAAIRTIAGVPQLTATSTATPPCTQDAMMALASSAPAPELGDRITVTVTLTNTGECPMGLPSYTLAVAGERANPAVVVSANPVDHAIGIGPGNDDRAQFQLTVLNTGVLTLTAHSSFEVHEGYPGPAYWSGANTDPLTITVPNAPPGQVVMTQAAHAAGCMDDPYSEATLQITSQRFACALAAGHSIGAQMTNYDDEAAARAAFLVRATGHALQPFAACRPSFTTKESVLEPLVLTNETWFGGTWLVVGESQDDTPAMGGETGAHAVHDALIVNGLLEPCRHNYLPYASTR